MEANVQLVLEYWRDRAIKSERMVAEAYQIIARLTTVGEIIPAAEIQRTLDYFSGKPIDGPILPWPRQ